MPSERSLATAPADCGFSASPKARSASTRAPGADSTSHDTVSPARLEPRGVAFQPLDAGDVQFTHPAPAGDRHRALRDARLDATAGDGAQVPRRGDRDRLALRRLEHRPGERVRGAALHRRRKAQCLVSRDIRGARTSTSEGLPSVSVPVLSKATTRVRWAISSASASLMRMPWRAATPVPTMTAVGVASPSAHGQAMTRTATALRIATSQSPVPRPHAEQRDERDRHHRRHEHLAHAVDEALDGSLAGLRRLDRADDPRQRALGADRDRPRDKTALGVHRAADEAASRRLGHRQALAGDERFVDMALRLRSPPRRRAPGRRGG